MRKREVVLRLLRGEPVDALSRELGVELYRLEEWKQRAFSTRGHAPWKSDCAGVGEVDAVKCAAGKAAFGDGYGTDA